MRARAPGSEVHQRNSQSFNYQGIEFRGGRPLEMPTPKKEECEIREHDERAEGERGLGVCWRTCGEEELKRVADKICSSPNIGSVCLPKYLRCACILLDVLFLILTRRARYLQAQHKETERWPHWHSERTLARL